MSNNVLAFVAEYAVNKAGTGFTTNHNIPSSADYDEWQDSDAGLFTWDEAKALFKKDFLKDYVFPSKEQWLSIVKNDNIFFNKEQSKVSVEEKDVVIGNEPKQTYQSEFITKQEGGKYVTYALRFKETKWESAWFYYLGDKGQSMVIGCLGGLKDSGKTLEEIATPTFFEQNTKKFVTRVFPFYGYRLDNSGSLLADLGNEGDFWSSTPSGSRSTWHVIFGRKVANVIYNNRNFNFAVRPFKKTL